MNARRISSTTKSSKRKRQSSADPSSIDRLAERRGFEVLIVDANTERRTLLSDLLDKDGFGVTAVEHGRAATAYILKSSIDLVITGIIMPGMDGLELLQVVRAVSRSLPVFVLSDGDTRVHSIYLTCAETLGATKTYPSPMRFRTVRDDVRRQFRSKHRVK
jgi:DNA-binding response OmpR family regulator